MKQIENASECSALELEP